MGATNEIGNAAYSFVQAFLRMYLENTYVYERGTKRDGYMTRPSTARKTWLTSQLQAHIIIDSPRYLYASLDLCVSSRLSIYLYLST